MKNNKGKAMLYLQSLNASESNLVPGDDISVVAVTHRRELGHEEVIPTVVRRRVLFYIRETDELKPPEY
jgi:hypothetical protein